MLNVECNKVLQTKYLYQEDRVPVICVTIRTDPTGPIKIPVHNLPIGSILFRRMRAWKKRTGEN